MLKDNIDKILVDPFKDTSDRAFIKSLHERLMHMAQEINQKLSDGIQKEESLKFLALALYYVKQGLP